MQFTLSFVRECKKYTVEEVAKHCGVSVGEMNEFENDPGEIPASIAMKLRKLYGLPIEHIKLSHAQYTPNTPRATFIY